MKNGLKTMLGRKWGMNYTLHINADSQDNFTYERLKNLEPFLYKGGQFCNLSAMRMAYWDFTKKENSVHLDGRSCCKFINLWWFFFFFKWPHFFTLMLPVEEKISS